MTLPLATYTAENGLAWFYDKSAIDFAELDQCRRLLGPLPDFDAGDKGYEGVAAVGGRVYVIRCVSAPKWDFMGRDATYLTVTWFPRENAANIDVEKILKSKVFLVPSHEHQHSFDVECETSGGNGAWSEVVQKIADDRLTVLARREIGKNDIVITVKEKEGEDEMTEAEKFFSGNGQTVAREGALATGESKAGVRERQPTEASQFSMGARVLGIVLFIVLILLGTYLAKIAGHILLGYIVGAAAFGVLRVLWRVGK